jgi:microcystin-dependent protein
MPTFLDYEIVPEDNESGTVPTRFPEGNFKGTWVNLCFRHMAAVIRDLGGRAAKLPHDEDDNIITINSGRVGTLAFQDADDVEITGGFFRGRGYVFVGAIMAYGGTWAEYTEVYSDLFARGWVVCDGRTVTNPYTSLSVTLPDLRGRYLRMFVNTAAAGNNFGADTQTTTAAGAHSHGDGTNATALTAANLPIKAKTETFTQNGDEDSLLGVESQTATAHSHTIPTVGDHAHTVDMLPLSVNVIYLKRVW